MTGPGRAMGTPAALTPKEARALAETCWNDPTWLGLYPLTAVTAMDYFALSPFYRPGPELEYVVTEVQEPHLFVIRQQRRRGPDQAQPLGSGVFFILNQVVDQAPSLHAVLRGRLGRCLHSLRASFAQVEKLQPGRGSGTGSAGAGGAAGAPAKSHVRSSLQPAPRTEFVAGKATAGIVGEVLAKYDRAAAAKAAGE